MAKKIIYEGQVAGVYYHKHREIETLGVPDRLDLVPDPNGITIGQAHNDPNAIAIQHAGIMLGYIPKVDTYKLHPYLIANVPVEAVLTFYNRRRNHMIVHVICEEEHILPIPVPVAPIVPAS